MFALLSALFARILVFGDPAVTVDQVIDANLKALGGAESIAAVRSFRMTGVVVSPGIPPLPVSVEWKRPNRIRIEVQAKDIQITQGYDGQRAWSDGPNGPVDDAHFPPKERAQLVRGARAGLYSLAEVRSQDFKAELIEPGEIAGRKTVRLRLSGADRNTYISSLDPATYLEIQRESITVVSEQEYETITELSDYREVGAIRQPFLIRSRPKDAEAATDIRVSSVVLNPDLPDSRFRPVR